MTHSLTVIIPHLNSPDGLSRCLDALAEQGGTEGRFAVVVVDNGSREMPESVCAQFGFVTLTSESTPGPGPARNLGVRLSSSDILAFIDCDCIAQPGWIDTILDYLPAHPETGAIGGDVRIAFSDPDSLTGIEAYEAIYGYRFKLYIEQHHYTGSGNMAVWRSVFEKVGGFGGIDIAEDRDWGHRATAMGIRIDYVPDMRIATPARETFQQLARKWDRHIEHDFEKIDSGVARFRWAVRAAALVVSPVLEVPRVLRSDRVHGARSRWLAFRCLTRIRLYRAGGMIRLLSGKTQRATSETWRSDI
ncbi:glycosyltransferase [Primorskyibacter sp. 2E233]|uniref:glycosyltransferase n=1 Tax=Primorskyibacter sp. 2E233 TaxID=3413431 RepID=UPI003BF41084